MPKIKLSHQRFIDATQAQAELIRGKMLDKNADGNLAIDLSGNTFRLREVKEVIMHDEASIPTEKYDIFRDRQYLEGFGKILETYGLELAQRERFHRYAIAKGLIAENGSVDRDRASEYRNEQDKFTAFLKLEDWKQGVTEEQERTSFDGDFIPKDASKSAIKEMLIGLERYIGLHPEQSVRAREIQARYIAMV